MAADKNRKCYDAMSDGVPYDLIARSSHDECLFIYSSIRINDGHPFETTGVDYAGLLYSKVAGE